MRDFSYKRCDKLRESWFESVKKCVDLLQEFNRLTERIDCLMLAFGDEVESDRVVLDLINRRLVVESELVAERVKCRKAYDDYYFEFPFVAAFDCLDMKEGECH